MVISLIAQRFSLAATLSIAAHPGFNSAFALATRRTFSVTPRYLAPPETESTKTKKATKKTTVESTPKESVEKKPVKAKSTDTKKGKPEQLPRRVPSHLKPPKAPCNPYMLFYHSSIKSQEIKGTADCHAAARRASQAWRDMSPAEKQPFWDEYEVAKVQAKKQKEEYIRNLDPADLRKVNRIHASLGKRRLVVKNPNPKPISAFLRFLRDFRADPESVALIEKAAHAKTPAARTTAAGAARWRAMSEEEKKPYYEEFAKEKSARTAS